ncbi:MULTISPECIES: hypothetical protein [Pseudoalteromonas]|uniref:Uncharacterized protein n=2 Tax=Pseudoalteromonas TaxID=53246 RepID=V4HII7_PSEL2|nr:MULTISPECIES: hypothetical protein [Pseudoalteromonas]ESP90615.1 hypothetical protein PL2TA16_01719 [Pseudoalteromonas luteoviolacea 2ta16]KZN41811.1 hypothetical protein N483_14160 [Pseudoalteromonas luteoviolacea NCIMB 1944]MBQ4837175.1 hypothetical protein [Pseudoalteromonas luteoviolacea]MCG7551321.1 hypothetical protein [Pseudoalteromonas sp. Of7M-16]MDK2595599.1 hypothetical protein [Pseudoalteromonas sp. P94(2023)]
MKSKLGLVSIGIAMFASASAFAGSKTCSIRVQNLVYDGGGPDGYVCAFDGADEVLFVPYSKGKVEFGKGVNFTCKGSKCALKIKKSGSNCDGVPTWTRSIPLVKCGATYTFTSFDKNGWHTK